MFSLSCKSPLLLFLLTTVGVATRLTDSWSHIPAEPAEGSAPTADPGRCHQVAFTESQKGSWNSRVLGWKPMSLNLKDIEDWI